MGHRALVAYRVRPGEYDVRYSHWGAAHFRLKHEITEDQPYADGRVDEEIRDDDCRRVSLETIKDEILSYTDYEALYLVSGDFEVTTFGVESYDLVRYTGTDRPTVNDHIDLPDYNPSNRGVCYPVRWYDGEPVSGSGDRGRIRGYVESAATLLETERFDDAEEAAEFIHGRVRGHFLGTRGSASQYDDPIISSEESVPLELQPSAQSLSSMMTDGGRDRDGGQQSISDF